VTLLVLLLALALGCAMLYLLFQVTALAYRIDRRSHPERYAPDAPERRLNIPAIAVNWKVARDSETQALRKQMNLRLLVIVAGFAAIGLLVSWAANSG
jgi:hypothetical protein